MSASNGDMDVGQLVRRQRQGAKYSGPASAGYDEEIQQTCECTQAKVGGRHSERVYISLRTQLCNLWLS